MSPAVKRSSHSLVLLRRERIPTGHGWAEEGGWKCRWLPHEKKVLMYRVFGFKLVENVWFWKVAVAWVDGLDGQVVMGCVGTGAEGGLVALERVKVVAGGGAEEGLSFRWSLLCPVLLRIFFSIFIFNHPFAPADLPQLRRALVL